MTVLETESPPHSVILPFDRAWRQHQLECSAAVLFCPNITSLPVGQFQKADRLLFELTGALLGPDVEAFNEVRQQLLMLIKKHGEPVTQWNPLILELTDPDILRGAKLPHINLSMVCLRSGRGKVSLEGAQLQNASFLCADLSQTILTEADLSGADLRFADLREVNLERSLLLQSDLSHAKLSYALLDGANLHSAKLNSALIKQARLQDVNLRRADLRNADFYQADLRHARLQQSDLREANLFMADLTGAKLRHADLRKVHAGFCNLRETRLLGARLAGADFTSANLALADLQRCKLAGILLSRAILERANLNQAELQGADLSEVQALETAVLKGITFDQDTLFPEGFIPGRQAGKMARQGLRRLRQVVLALLGRNPERRVAHQR